jgi:hypothetical protein
LKKQISNPKTPKPYNRNRLLTTLLATLVNTTILIELNGIKIAAIIGVSCPVTAKYSPTILYKKEKKKAHFMIFFPLLATSIK